MIINEMQLYLNDQILTGHASISLVLRKIGVLKYIYIELIDQLKLTILYILTII